MVVVSGIKSYFVALSNAGSAENGS